MCQEVYIKKNSRINCMNMCINCDNVDWNKVKRDKRKCSNYDEQIKAGSHTKLVSLSPERSKTRIKNENHRRKLSSLMLRNAQKKPDNLKNEVEAKDNEGEYIFLLLKKDLNSQMTK